MVVPLLDRIVCGFVAAFDGMQVGRSATGDVPLLRGRVLYFERAVSGVDFARGVQTFRELFGSQIVPQAVEHVGVGISDTGLHHDAFGCVFPIADNAQGLFALQVFRPVFVPIVDR